MNRKEMIGIHILPLKISKLSIEGFFQKTNKNIHVHTIIIHYYKDNSCYNMKDKS
jgi:hypothetical protein